MSLAFGVAILVLAVVAGGLVALMRRGARGEESATYAVRTFAIVAAASVALLHLLPEAIGAIGPLAIVATFLGAVVPAVLERAIQPHADHSHEAPTTALAMGYAAVIAHQAGEGAAIASLARTGALSVAVVLAIAAHTIPLAMVVAIRVAEARGERGPKRAMTVALGGVIGATIGGALAGKLVETSRLLAYQPWILAAVAGLLLHALAHDALATHAQSTRARIIDTGAGIAGLAIALVGTDTDGWFGTLSIAGRGAIVAIGVAAIAARGFRTKKPHDHAHHS